jgi:peptide-methionine (S)-S-oxide reductase
MKTVILLILLNLTLPTLSFAAESAPKGKNQEIKTVIFAGGCFWCMQPPFDALKSKGVISTSVGYSGGHTESPTYEQTSSGGTGHREVIQVTYDAQKIGLNDLLVIFWQNIDPFDGKGQFCDKGEQYTSAVYYSNDAEKKTINESLKLLENKGKKTEKVVTQILPSKTFYKAEDYHQSYYEKNPVKYKYYRFSCGRDARLKEIWGSGAGHF